MSNVFNLVSEETYIEQTDKLAVYLAAIAAKGDGTLRPTSWSDVQSIVRNGLASKVFAIGDQLSCKKGDDVLVWDIIGIDHDTPADPQFTHSLTLQLHDCFPTTIQFDAPEAFYYCETALEAGTYHFAIDSTYDATRNDLTSYQFTLTQAVPAGGQLTFPWDTHANASTIKVNSFASTTSTTVIEQVSVTEGTDGQELGTLTVAGDFTNNLNSIHKVRFGNNNYKESAIRQWLSSSAAAGSVWTPQTKFDRPPLWAANTAGFINGMDADFLAVLGEVTKVTAKNTVTGGGYDVTSDKFFLLSRSEVYGGVEVGGVNEGSPYPYYADYSDLSAPGMAADSNRIKYRNGSAQYWWLRATYDASVRPITTTGSVYSREASNAYGIAPACNII